MLDVLNIQSSLTTLFLFMYRQRGKRKRKREELFSAGLVVGLKQTPTANNKELQSRAALWKITRQKGDQGPETTITSLFSCSFI